MQKSRDPFVMWIISGIIGVIVRDVYSLLAKIIGLAKFFIWNVGAALFVKVSEIKTFQGTVLGLLTDLVVGGMLGVVIGLLLEWRGTKNYIIKGWGVGLLAWLFFYGLLFHNIPHTMAQAPDDAMSNLSAFIGHSIYGIITSIIYIRFFAKKYIDSTAKSNSTVNSPAPQVLFVEIEHQQPSLWRQLRKRFIR